MYIKFILLYTLCTPLHDLNPVNFSIWGALKAKVYRGLCDKLGWTEDSNWGGVGGLSQEIIDHAINSFKSRLKRVIEENGGHIEKIMIDLSFTINKHHLIAKSKKNSHVSPCKPLVNPYPYKITHNWILVELFFQSFKKST